MVAMAPAGSAPGGTSLFAWVKAELRSSITRGEHRPGEPFVTQREVVQRFGVSTTTAVRALNELVAEGLVVRRRGLGTFVAEQRPSAPPGAGQRAIAFISHDDVGPHMGQVLAGLSARSSELGYRLVVAHTGAAETEEQLLRRVAAEGAAAVVIFPQDRSRAAPVVAQLGRHGVPVVVIDRYYPHQPTDAVLFDDVTIGYDVTAAVLDRGHTEVAALWSEEEVTSVHDRLSGHLRALRERGVPELPERHVLVAYSGLPEAVRRRRLQRVLDARGPGRPLTAVVCGNAWTLATVLSDLLSLDASLAGAVELASMDEAGPYNVSPLAVVSAQLPSRRMGEAAIDLVHQRLEGSTAPARHVVLPAPVRVAEQGVNVLAVVSAVGQPTRPAPAPALARAPALAQAQEPGTSHQHATAGR
jgi:DNA-binding LacI/PurR family transcriptional regulator